MFKACLTALHRRNGGSSGVAPPLARRDKSLLSAVRQKGLPPDSGAAEDASRQHHHHPADVLLQAAAPSLSRRRLTEKRVAQIDPRDLGEDERLLNIEETRPGRRGRAEVFRPRRSAVNACPGLQGQAQNEAVRT